jgi:hypothetical protein
MQFDPPLTIFISSFGDSSDRGREDRQKRLPQTYFDTVLGANGNDFVVSSN